MKLDREQIGRLAQACGLVVFGWVQQAVGVSRKTGEQRFVEVDVVKQRLPATIQSSSGRIT